MSEFECSNGHMPAPSQIRGMRCPECGARIVRMDGHSAREWRGIEEDYQRKLEEESKKELEEGGEEE